MRRVLCWVGRRSQHSQVVEEAETNSEEHVDDPEDDGHLHLEGVEEGQLVGGQIPDLDRKGNDFKFGVCLVETESSEFFEAKHKEGRHFN